MEKLDVKENDYVRIENISCRKGTKATFRLPCRELLEKVKDIEALY